MDDASRKLMKAMGDAIMKVADGAKVDEAGDLAVFGSTNDLDLLKGLRQRWFEYEYLPQGKES